MTTADAAQPSPLRSPVALGVAVALAVGMLVFAIVRLAWVGDDAYITFRSIENWYHGHGLRWNVADRAQTYTCPLWMLCCAVGRLATGELYFTTLVLSGVATTGAIWLLWRLGGRGAGTLLAIAVMALSSRCLLDFSTSGLENPLSHLLLATFVTIWHAERLDPAGRCFRLGLVGALVATTRMDLALLTAPAILVAAFQLGWRRALPRLALASLPFVGWIAFVMVYYGTPFPTTAYSKLLAVGLPLSDLALQGCRYVAVLVLRDPASALSIALAVAVSSTRAGRRQLPLAVGIVLYCAYVVRIGGDFMAGRFFSSPWVVAAAILCVHTKAWAPRFRLGGACALLAVAFTPGVPAAFTGSGKAEDTYELWKVYDIRQQGWVACGLLAPERRRVIPGAISTWLRQTGQTEPAYEVHGVVGERGFQGGPLLHIVDPWLCDPVLSRLPTRVREDWQISHFTRRIPEGYLELLARGDGSRCDPRFLRFARTVFEVTRGEPWSGARWRAVWELLGGGARRDLESWVDDSYHRPPTLTVRAADLPPPVAPDTWWFRCRALVLYEGGLDVEFEAPQHGASLEIEFGPAAVYRCQFCRGAEVLFATEVPTDFANELGGMRMQQVPLPPAAQGFTTLRIRPGFHSAVMAVGAARVVAR